MSKGIFITATGTDIGKTYVTALIIKKLCEAGYNSGYYKAALSGAVMTKHGLHAQDAHHVKTIANFDDDYSEMVSYVYESAVSPHLAAKMEGNPVCLDKIMSDYERQCSKYDYITVEGSGGIICPIRYDSLQKIYLEDIIKKLKLPVLIVADAGLGTINATVLTVKYIESKDILIKGIVLNRYHEGIMQDDNIKMIEAITNIPVVALIKENDTSIDIELDVLEELYKKDGK